MEKYIAFILIFFAFNSCKFENAEKKVSNLLDTNKELSINNIIEANKIITNTKTFNKKTAYKIEVLMTTYLDKLAEKTTNDLNNIIEASSHYSSIEDSINNIIDLYKENGLDIYMSEGYIITEVRPIYIIETFHQYKSNQEKQIARLYQLEVDQPTTIDASIAISYKELCYRLHICDSLLLNQNTEETINTLVSYQNLYLSLLMVGLENTPSFDWETNKLLPEIRIVIEDYIKIYPSYTSSKTLNTFLSTIVNNDYRETEETEIFISNFLKNQEQQ